VIEKHINRAKVNTKVIYKAQREKKIMVKPGGDKKGK
jgi:hypothetical protein